MAVITRNRVAMRYNRSTLTVDLRWLVVAVGLALVAGSTGCGDGKIRRYPVTGTVLVDGKPAQGAMVIFCPTSGSDEVMKHRPFGVTGTDGKFQLTTLEKADGAASADYKVLVQWLGGGSAPVDDGRGGIELGPDRLRGRYMNLERSELVAAVKDAPVELPPFELKSK